MATNQGVPKFEPLVDLAVTEEAEPDSTPKRQGPPTGRNTKVWKNKLGVTKAWGSLDVTALGADGCQASFTATFTSSAAFPFVVEPKTASPPVTITCFPKPDCECRGQAGQKSDGKPTETEEDEMECGQASQAFSVVGRIGTQWFGADIISYPGVVKAWACADGQAGRGNF